MNTVQLYGQTLPAMSHCQGCQCVPQVPILQVVERSCLLMSLIGIVSSL
jgi:hypothetical protein